MISMWSRRREKKQKSRNSTWDWIQSLGVALILALMIKASIVEAYKIPSASMESTLLVGDFLLANKFIYGMRLPIPFADIRLPALTDPKPGDIVIFKNPRNLKQNFIKRCVAVEGQTVEIVDKQLYVDGKTVPLPSHAQFVDPRINHNSYRDNLPKTIVPKGMIFVIGDNRDNSLDSRSWGPLDRQLVRGKPMIIHWSWAADPNAPRTSLTDPVSWIESFAYNVFHFPERVRWSRIGDIVK